MSHSFQLELASPEKLVVGKQVVMAIVPGDEGLYGVLAGHAPMIASIGAGVIEIYDNDDHTVTERYFIAGGFTEVAADRCTVLAEQIVPITDLNRIEIEKEIANLDEKLATIELIEDREPVETRLQATRAKLFAAA
jgi:F-type H+-transporting ATPase subunit epsilon